LKNALINLVRRISSKATSGQQDYIFEINDLFSLKIFTQMDQIGKSQKPFVSFMI